MQILKRPPGSLASHFTTSYCTLFSVLPHSARKFTRFLRLCCSVVNSSSLIDMMIIGHRGICTSAEAGLWQQTLFYRQLVPSRKSVRSMQPCSGILRFSWAVTFTIYNLEEIGFSKELMFGLFASQPTSHFAAPFSNFSNLIFEQESFPFPLALNLLHFQLIPLFVSHCATLQTALYFLEYHKTSCLCSNK